MAGRRICPKANALTLSTRNATAGRSEHDPEKAAPDLIRAGRRFGKDHAQTKDQRRSMPVPLDVRASPRLSIVAPCYNEEAGLEEFYRRMTEAAQETAGSDYEFVLLNDGSRDRTWAIMADLVRRDPRVVAVNLSRRHGHQLAITAGLYTCRGERILTIDADLQDPPELLPEMWRLMDKPTSSMACAVSARARPCSSAAPRLCSIGLCSASATPTCRSMPAI